MKILRVDDFFLSDEHAFSLFDMHHQMMEDVHAHEFDELVIVRHGSGFHIINDQVQFICQGDFFLVSASDIHCYESANELSVINILLHRTRPFHFIKNIDVLKEGVRERTSPLKNKRVALSEIELEAVIRLAGVMNNKSDLDSDADYFSSTESALLSIISLLYCCATKKEEKSGRTESGKRYLLNHLLENYHCAISWQGLCETSGITKRTMFRFIKQTTGYTPEKFQLRYRLLKTQELLRTTDYAIGEIALMCGFTHHARLTEAYKKQFSRTPSQERARVSNSVI
ncbi:helix-turn-helix domain-containing protein [Rahnella inusitata]|uniref:helix-turn-helix domain-containing protein n=1 Tax=Rahnella inusitata TaxID=58169 RepID=UPI0039B10E25